MIKLLKLFFKSKWKITKPKKKDILVYDRMSVKNGFADSLFKKNSYEVIYTRYELINLYVLFFTIYKHGFKNIRNNYRLVYFDMVSPKIIYSGIDSNAVFYKLKNIYSKSFFINDQYGISKVTGKGWPNNFYWEIKKYNKKNKKKASADIIFVFGSNEKGRLKPIIDAKYYTLGNTKNNSITTNTKIKTTKEISYICSGLWQPSWNRQRKTFKILSKYCDKNKIILNFIPKKTQIKFGYFNESYYRKKLGKGNWRFIEHKSLSNGIYNFLITQKLVVFAHSTLGFEILSRGIKTLVLTSDFPEKNSSNDYNNKGPFWTDAINEKEIFFYINKIYKMKKKKWNKLYGQYAKEIMTYDKNNKKKKMIINSILKR